MAANAITLSGNLVKDPEMSSSKTGKLVVSFRIAVDGAGSAKDESGFFTCHAWEPLAENLGETLEKGQRVIVTGELRHRSYEVDGKKRSTTEILVEDAGPSMLWATAKVTRKTREASSQAEPEAVPVPA